MSALLGRAWVRTDGKLLRTNEGAKIDIGGAVREPKVGTHTVHGYIEKIKESMVECEISLATGDKLDDFRRITNATITFECDTGQRYLIRGAWLAEPPVITEGDGGAIPLKFVGPPAEEV